MFLFNINIYIYSEKFILEEGFLKINYICNRYICYKIKVALLVILKPWLHFNPYKALLQCARKESQFKKKKMIWSKCTHVRYCITYYLNGSKCICLILKTSLANTKVHWECLLPTNFLFMLRDSTRYDKLSSW